MSDIEALIQSDQSAFNRLFDEYHKPLYYFFIKYTGCAEDAEDLVQQSFIKIWQGRTGLSVHYSFSRQLFSVAKSCMIDHFRKQQRQSALRVEYLANTNTKEPSVHITDFDLEQRIDRAIEHLPPSRRKVFRMSRIDGFTYQEIAEQLSVSVKTVESQIHKAIKQLRKALNIF